MGFLDKFRKDKDESKPDQTKGKQPKFVRKYTENQPHGISTYEIYEGTDAESAKTFLLTKRVDKKLYYIMVETSEGNWGIDIEGLYLEKLLPWQLNINSAECAGTMILMSWSMFGLNAVAKKFSDNFIVKVQCGKCEHQWLDGVRYQNLTVVRCPKCKTLNKVDTSSAEVIFI